MCGSLGIYGAHCDHYLTTETEDLSMEQVLARWNDLSNPQVMTPLSGIIQFEEEISKLCSDYEKCTDQQAQAQKIMLRLVSKLKSMHQQLKVQ
jgi:hypothetical protein